MAAHITVTPSGKRVKVTFKGVVVADTARALELREGSHPPTLYIPRADADLALLHKTTHATGCPHKGQASYFTIKVGAAESQNAIWSYETPHEGVAAIKGHLAFYPDRIDLIEVG